MIQPFVSSDMNQPSLPFNIQLENIDLFGEAACPYDMANKKVQSRASASFTEMGIKNQLRD